MWHLDGFCLATFSDTFATQCDMNSLNFTGGVPTTDEHRWTQMGRGAGISTIAPGRAQMSAPWALDFGGIGENAGDLMREFFWIDVSAVARTDAR